MLALSSSLGVGIGSSSLDLAVASPVPNLHNPVQPPPSAADLGDGECGPVDLLGL